MEEPCVRKNESDVYTEEKVGLRKNYKPCVVCGQEGIECRLCRQATCWGCDRKHVSFADGVVTVFCSERCYDNFETLRKRRERNIVVPSCK